MATQRTSFNKLQRDRDKQEKAAAKRDRRQSRATAGDQEESLDAVAPTGNEPSAQAILPQTTLTLRTFFEVWIGYWYGLMKDMMGPRRAKRYFPLIGSLACFIFFSNALGLIPGFAPPTSNWNVTMGCALVVFVMFNYYGFRANGFGHIAHLFGPYIGWWAIPINLLLFVVEFVSMLIRPLTLSIRLMLNMAVDHLLITLTLGMVALFLPIPVLVLGTLVVVIQVMVFSLLSSIYISLATEHEDHEPEHGAATDAAHAH